MSIHEQARAEAGRQFPERFVKDGPRGNFYDENAAHRGVYTAGYLAGHEAGRREAHHDHDDTYTNGFTAGAEWAATRARVVTTVAELDALPIGSVVMTGEGWLAKKFETTQTQHWDVTELWRRGNYPDVRLIEHGPLTVLYEPEETR